MLGLFRLPTADEWAVYSSIAALLFALWRRFIIRWWRQWKVFRGNAVAALAELAPNGGGSIRDRIASIHAATIVAEQRNRAMLDSESHGVFEASASGRWKFANRAFSRWTGRSAGEIEGYGWVNILHRDDKKAVEAEWQAAIAESRSFEMAFRIVDSAGDAIRVVARANPVFDPNPASRVVVGYFGIVMREERQMSIEEISDQILLLNARTQALEHGMVAATNSIAALHKRLPEMGRGPGPEA